MTAVDSTVMDTMAAAAMDTMVAAVDSRGMAVTTTTWRRCRPQKTQPAVRGTQGRGRQQSGGMRADARQARWADIALAGVGKARISPADSREAVVLMMLTARGRRCGGARSC